MPGEDSSIGEVLTRPSVQYAPQVLGAVDTAPVKGAAHITGGGLPGNLPRTLPTGCGAVLDPVTWEIPNVFRVIAERGPVSWPDMADAFNLGLGFCLVVAPSDAEAILAATAEVRSRVVGEVVEGSGVAFSRDLA
jgi:phosphoribosylformylglycinamidine cyclo-ligase